MIYHARSAAVEEAQPKFGLMVRHSPLTRFYSQFLKRTVVEDITPILS
jgi:hypothetical protein